MNRTLTQLAEKLRDERSKKVIFVSHCTLNENTRYFGGAFCTGCNKDVLNEILLFDSGIVQIPCPEEMVWGGVLKKLIWIPINTSGKLTFQLMRVLFPIFFSYTYIRYSRLASKVRNQIKDYIKSGFEVVGIIGIDGSPTCGVNTNLDLRESFRYISTIAIDDLERDKYNKNLYRICKKKDSGLFIKILKKKIRRSGINLKYYSTDLEEEMIGINKIKR